ncbi:MAG: hypothetical protein Q7T20_16960 [Saprospiraceae bacterium]|nr:hypothetical protein [Saprospiraceae bacterium]
MAQKVLLLDNPSFEHDGSGGAGIVPEGWLNLGAEDQTPPDIQPGFFGVTMSAQHGHTYLGLVVRKTGTWEGVGQKLHGYLKKGSAYSFSLWLTRSNSFKSAVLGDPETVDSNNPIKFKNQDFNNSTVLKIWGYNTQTRQEELLAESQPVSHSKWVRYEFELKPTLDDFDELDLMAYYAPGAEKKNGNLLIDNCSAIVKIEK